MRLSKFSVQKPITIVMMVLIVVLVGVISLMSLKTDLFPSMNLPYAVVSTSYYGASPEEVELAVTKPIESAMATVDNIKTVQSISRENSSLVILEFNQSSEMDSVMIEMRENLDMIMRYMPDGVEDPVIMKLNPEMMPVMNFSISVEGMDLAEATGYIKDEIIPRFERIEGVASITLSGTVQNEVQIRLDDSKIKRFNDLLNDDMEQEMLNNLRESMPSAQIPLQPSQQAVPEWEYQVFISRDMVEGILKGQNFEMPSGYLIDHETDYLVRIGDKFSSVGEINSLTILKNKYADIKLSDIAEVEMTDTSKDTFTKVNGENAIMASVQKQNNYATTEVAKKVKEEIAAIEDDLDKADMAIIMDQAAYIDLAVGSVSTNLIYGGILAVIILLLFLKDLRPTAIVAVSIPISILAAFILIYLLDITMNIVSMGGLALGIGMLVDNSIVVIENIYRQKSEGKSTKKAAIKGARQVAGAITASTLTTIAVFLPIIFMEGLTAEIFSEMALTISCSLGASLLIALTFVPMAASALLRSDYQQKNNKLLDRLQKGYGKLLKKSLNNKAAVILGSMVLFAGSIWGALQMGTEYFPESDTGQIDITLNMEAGTSFNETAEALEKVSAVIQTIDGVETVAASIGSSLYSPFGSGSNKGSVYVLLTDDTRYSTQQVAQMIRNKTAGLGYNLEIIEQAMDMTSMMASGISVEIRGYEFDTLEKIANDVAVMVSDVDGTTEIDNGISKSSPEIKITVDKDKAIENGLTAAQVYMAIDENIDPDNKVSTLSMNGRDYNMILLSENEGIADYSTLQDMELATPIGGTVKLKDIASIEKQKGYNSISRLDQERTLTVSAALEEGYNIGMVGDEIQQKLDDYNVPSGYSVKLAGENEQIQDTFRDLGFALALAVILIYMIMAAQFQSFSYPFIVMFTIPLAFTGSFLALFITGTPISIVAFIGMIVLAGVVVNNGIVLVDYTNQLKEEGAPYNKAVTEAGKTRMRPILMTALTTIFALSTMSVGMGRGAEMMQPMAITAIGGLLFATVLTLFLVPCLYAWFDQIKARRMIKMENRASN